MGPRSIGPDRKEERRACVCQGREKEKRKRKGKGRTLHDGDPPSIPLLPKKTNHFTKKRT